MTIPEALEIVRGELFGAGTMSLGYMSRVDAMKIIIAALPKPVTQELIHAWSIQWQNKPAEAIEDYLTGAIHALGHEILPAKEKTDVVL
jgi:hypothetical protein